MKGSGVQTHTHNGVPDLQREEDLGRALDKARKEGERRAKAEIVKGRTNDQRR